MDDNRQMSRELATRDIEAIKQLRENGPFNTYFLRRLRMKHDAIEEKFKYDTPQKCDAAEREILRRLMLEYENEILSLMDRDDAAAQSTLTG